MVAERVDLTTEDGRTLEVWVASGTSRSGLLQIPGTPVGALPWEAEASAAAAAGVRYVTFSRPGYGTSTRLPGRSVADVAADVGLIAATLGIDRLHVVGHSGGGPHALACAALLPGLVASAATIGGVAPWGVEGLDWLAGMAEENVEEFGAALAGEEALTTALAPMVAGLADVTAEAVADELGGLVSDVDRACLTGNFAEITAARFRWAVHRGAGGWIDDDLAFTRDWGFDLSAISCPVIVWQGSQDLMVPPAHGEWLVAHVPRAVPRLFPEEGHLSLAVGRYAEIVADVVARGAAPA
jgi:pimeloyl-ACP methyl ester carboxylesterase